MTFWIILSLASILSYFSFRHINILLSLAASTSWLTLMAYNTTNPPTNIAVGSTVHEWLTFVFIMVAIATMYMWFRNRGRTESVTRVGLGDGEIVAHTTKREGVTGGEDAYRQRVRKALHPNRRRR